MELLEQIFLTVLNISIYVSILIITVIIARMLLRRAPKWCVMLLWAVVALRLLIPFQFRSALSLIPRGMDTKIASLNTQMIAKQNIYDIAEGLGTVKKELSVFEIAGYIWIAGVGLMLIFSLFSYLKLKHRLEASVKFKDNIFLSDKIATAFILGVFRPRIYLPSGIDEEEIAYVMAHEYSHIKRGDHIWKPLAYLLLCVYWFNPFIWLAYSLISRDIEYACDEKTISGYDLKERKAYAEALLDNSAQKQNAMACPLAFGECSIKERVRNVLEHKKPAWGLSLVSLVVVAIVGICFATKPKADIEKIIKNEGCESVKRRIEITEGLDIDIRWKEEKGVIVLAVSKKGEGKDEFSRQEYDVITETIDIVFSEYDYRVEWCTPIGNS